LKKFSELGISSPVMKALGELGFENPTQIQQEAVPYLLNESGDFIGLASTGTGKTAAFGLPLIEKIDSALKATQALILAPTRELGQQIAQQIKEFSKHLHEINVQVVYGGAPIMQQMKDLRKKPQIVIATPGRLIDLIKRKAINISNIKYFVLDEADEMLNMGFKEDIDHILSFTEGEKAIWLFSATMPTEIRRIVKEYMNNPFEVAVNTLQKINENISHYFITLKNNQKPEALINIVAANQDIYGIVFCRTKRDTQELADLLNKTGLAVEALHGDLNQNQRERVMRGFKKRDFHMLIATDVAARGIDVNDLTHVIHYALPDDMDNYTHRSGRTARAGKKGSSIAFISRGERKKISYLENKLKINFQTLEFPSDQEVLEMRIDRWAQGLVEKEVSSKVVNKLVKTADIHLNSLTKEELVQKLVQLEVERSGINPDKPTQRPTENNDARKRESGRTERVRRDRDRDSRRPKSNTSNDRYFINVGKMDKLSPNDLKEVICEFADVKAKDVSEVEVLKKHSYFSIDKQQSGKIIPAFKDLEFEGRKVRINRED
jgi:ATP-dependent RNA helicase DeaD